MKPKVICIIAGALLAMSLSTTAAASEKPAKPATEAEKPEALAVAKEHPAPTAAQESQQNRMKRCNEEARKKEVKGDERRAFMSTCLKKPE